MSKELAFTDDNDVVKYLDTTTAFNLALTADGVAFDLTNAKSILVKIANDDGYIMQQTIDLTTVTSPLGGTLSFPINQDIMNTLVPDDYDIEVWVTMNDGTQAIFPSDGTLGFSIEENLMSDTGEVIPTITLNDFQQQFNDLSNQMENAVHNVQKGDKGDTGTGLEIKDKVSSVSNLPPTANEGDGYLVGEELYVRVNNTWKDCGTLRGPKGDQGIQGNTGTGISSTTVQYQISSSATTVPTGIWSNNIIATTTTNPYLWMKATLNYTDHTTKVFYLVSQKGDKGDTGPTGPIGPIGPKGPTGSGLVIKGTVKEASQLPTAGNQEGYCYFIGTDLYVWDAGAWKNCGSVSPDLSNYVTITDLNNGLSTKVTDNKDGTEQLNGAKVQPFNKLSDAIGGRNYLVNTQNPSSTNPVKFLNASATDTLGTATFSNGYVKLASIVSSTASETYYRFISPNPTVMPLPSGTYTLVADLTSSDNVYIRPRGQYSTVGASAWKDLSTPIWKDLSTPIWNPSSTEQRYYYTFTIPSNTTGWYISLEMYADINGAPDNTGKSFQFRNASIQKGNITTDSPIAPEDKADDSKVVHDNHDGSVQVNGVSIIPLNGSQDTSQPYGLDLNKYKDTGSYRFDAVNTIHYPATFSPQYIQLIVFGNHGIDSSGNSGACFQIAIQGDRVAFRNMYTPTTYNKWRIVSDDSKVAHLSGANNFDTVPTVDHNPLLLASSLPSDLARTGSNQEFTGKNTFDTAPIDKTTGHPYITKDGVPAVPPTLADTTKDANFTGKLQKSGVDVATKTDVTNAVNTATSNVVTTNKLANFTAGLQVDGTDVATKSDIPSNTNTNDPRVDKLIGNLTYVILDMTANDSSISGIQDSLINQLKQGL